MAVKIRQRPKDSGIWWIFINHAGKRKAKKIGKDKKLAREVAKRIEKKLLLGEFDLDPRSKYPTFREYGNLWLQLPSDRKASSTDLYRNNLNKHIYPCIGAMRINDIERRHLKAMTDTLLTKGYSTGFFCGIKAPVNSILSHALDAQLISNNPLTDLKVKSKKTPYKVDPLTEAQAWQLLDKAEGYQNGLYYPALLCSLRTGLRVGELQALTWEDIDLEGRLIDINKTYSHGIITATKNRKTRKVDMTPALTNALRDLKRGKIVSVRVFSPARSKVLSRDAYRKALNSCLKQAGLPKIRIHDLRHSYATIRLLKGHNIGDVSYQMGHSSIAITYDVYATWVPGHFKSEVDDLDTRPVQLNATEEQPREKNFGKR